MTKPILLGVNIDHVATLRQARGTVYPDPVQAALQAESAGADSITAHLREDRRHIQDADIENLQNRLTTHLNLELAATPEMLAIACRLRPRVCCIVPEKRQELTTEGGLNVRDQLPELKTYCATLAEHDIAVSLFVDPEPKQIEAAATLGVPLIEINTGQYAERPSRENLQRIQAAVKFGLQRGLRVNAGHGLHLDNVSAIAAIPGLEELNIGHAIIAQAVSVGLSKAVRQMKAAMHKARL